MKVNWLRMRSVNAELAYFDYEIWSGKDMEYIRYYSTIILWTSPFALSGIIRNYDGEFPSKIARTLFHQNNISYVGRMIIRPSNENGRSRTIDIYVRCFPDS